MVMLARFRRLGRSWVRRDDSDGFDGMGRHVWVHVSGSDDVSPVFSGYVPECGLCWLGGTHSTRAHVARLGGE